MWTARLRENYKDLDEFKVYDEPFGLSERLGYRSPEAAWKDNPMVQGSTNPSDYKRVEERKGKKGDKNHSDASV